MAGAFRTAKIRSRKNPDLTHAGNFFYKLNGEVPQDWQIRMMDTIFILYADHEFNASTFAARVTASTLADMYAAVTSACATLKGPLHGGANEESMKMLDEIKTPDRAEEWLMETAGEESEDHGLRSSRLQKRRFARADHARDRARPGQTHGQRTLDSDLREARGKRWSARNIFARMSIFMPRRCSRCWISDPELNTPIFAASRVAGWCAHVVEQHDHNRLIRPRSLYTGPELRPYPGVSTNGA